MQALIVDEYEHLFLSSNKQKNILCSLSECGVLADFNCSETVREICICGTTNISLVKASISIVANILLNNYAKMRTNHTRDDKFQLKRRKLSTLL